MDFEFEDVRPRYRLCRAGFGMMALALGLLCLDACCGLYLTFNRNHELIRVLESEWWKWLVGAPITWVSLAGSYLLWGRWKEPVWQRRAGLLVLLNFIDLISWTIDHSTDLGLKIPAPPHPWLRLHLTMAFGWVELYLTATMATDLILHLEHQPPDFSRAAASFALVGLAVGVMIFITQTNWEAGWPLKQKPFLLNAVSGLLELGRRLLLPVTSFLVTALCLATTMRCGQYLTELDRHAGQEHELLKSRSESEEDFSTN